MGRSFRTLQNVSSYRAEQSRTPNSLLVDRGGMVVGRASDGDHLGDVHSPLDLRILRSSIQFLL